MPVVDLSFHLTGTVIPVDHGYSLYGGFDNLKLTRADPRKLTTLS